MSTEAIVGATLTIGAALIGLAVAWGRLGARVIQLEKEIARFEALQKEVTAIDVRTRDSAADQGRRLGAVEKLADSLGGKFEEFKSGFNSGRRSRTAAHGMPTITGMPRAGDFGDKGDK